MTTHVCDDEDQFTACRDGVLEGKCHDPECRGRCAPVGPCECLCHRFPFNRDALQYEGWPRLPDPPPADPYDEDRYCNFCGNGARGHHAPWCSWDDERHGINWEALTDFKAPDGLR